MPQVQLVLPALRVRSLVLPDLLVPQVLQALPARLLDLLDRLVLQAQSPDLQVPQVQLVRKVLQVR